MSSPSEKQPTAVQDTSLGRSDGDPERGDDEPVRLYQSLAQAQQPFGSSKAMWGWLVLNLSVSFCPPPPPPRRAHEYHAR